MKDLWKVGQLTRRSIRVAFKLFYQIEKYPLLSMEWILPCDAELLIVCILTLLLASV